ncbi:MAG: 16S rRNA (cytidine(1402)-2'-O)-methyltransferase [Pseudomonadota bacterium]
MHDFFLGTDSLELMDDLEPTQKEIGTPQAIVSGLYLVATPIGNLRDITLRALDVMVGVDVVYCEDTRVSGKLLQAYGIKKKLAVYNDHSSDGVRKKIIESIEQGQSVALISDAGTPLISDPGYKLVRDCLAARVNVTSLPGANAVLAGLQLSGLPSDTFTFHGFLPSKSRARKKVFEQWQNVQTTHVFYETGPRLEAALKDCLEIWRNREVSVVRELTKRFEEIKAGTIKGLLDSFEKPKGEIVLVIGAPLEVEMSDVDIDGALRDALKIMSVKEAAAHVSGITGKPKKELYARALDLKS